MKSLLNDCFIKKIQQNTPFHSILKLNIDKFENKIHNPQ